MPALDLLTDVLATARITRLVTEDEIAQPLRDAMEQSGSEKLEYLATCPYCVSVWAGLLVTLKIVPKPVRRALALSEAVVAFRAAVDALPSRW